jgi:hypothetical protein
MGVKYILFSVIIILIVIASSLLIIQESPQKDPQYKIIHIRDLTFNSYEFSYNFKNNPTRDGTADDRYTAAVHRYHDKLNLAKDRIRIEQKNKSMEYTS